jgi:hypothetical protein
MADKLAGRREHYLELAVRVRAVAGEARFPAARKTLIAIAKRFEQGAGTLDHLFFGCEIGTDGRDDQGV